MDMNLLNEKDKAMIRIIIKEITKNKNTLKIVYNIVKGIKFKNK